MADLRLAVLDMAGTTVSDDGLVRRAFDAALADAGVDEGHPDRPDHERVIQQTMGSSKIEVFRQLFGSEEVAQSANRAFERSIDDDVAGGRIAPIPGAEEALARLRAAGLKICLTTGFSRPTQEELVAQLGWADLVDLSLAPHEGVRGRPHPDLVFTAIMQLELDDVAQVAVAGDTANDLRAGSRAGAAVVAGVLTGAHDRGQLTEAPHTHVLDSIAELPDVVGA